MENPAADAYTLATLKKAREMLSSGFLIILVTAVLHARDVAHTIRATEDCPAVALGPISLLGALLRSLPGLGLLYFCGWPWAIVGLALLFAVANLLPFIVLQRGGTMHIRRGFRLTLEGARWLMIAQVVAVLLLYCQQSRQVISDGTAVALRKGRGPQYDLMPLAGLYWVCQPRSYHLALIQGKRTVIQPFQLDASQGNIRLAAQPGATVNLDAWRASDVWLFLQYHTPGNASAPAGGPSSSSRPPSGQ